MCWSKRFVKCMHISACVDPPKAPQGPPVVPSLNNLCDSHVQPIPGPSFGRLTGGSCGRSSLLVLRALGRIRRVSSRDPRGDELIIFHPPFNQPLISRPGSSPFARPSRASTQTDPCETGLAPTRLQSLAGPYDVPRFRSPVPLPRVPPTKEKSTSSHHPPDLSQATMRK